MRYLSLKLSITLFVFITLGAQLSIAQNYIDLFKINYTVIPSSSYEEVDGENDISIFDVSATYPIKINDRLAIITGLDYIQQRVALFPNASRITLNNLNLKVGLNIKYTDKFSGTYVFIPRISSQGLHTEGNYLRFGGAAIFKYQVSERFQWRFGAYASTEGFGFLATPVLGFYYKSKDDKLEVTANLPVSADVNYSLGSKTSAGFAFSSPVKTYSNKPQTNIANTYTEIGNIELGPYFEYGLKNNSLLLRAQAGYEALSYEVYNEGDELPFRLVAFKFGDERKLLNPDFNAGLFFKVGLTYRFHLDK